jgi:hypothetical protein
MLTRKGFSGLELALLIGAVAGFSGYLQIGQIGFAQTGDPDQVNQRTIYMAAVEPSGGADVEREPLPPALPPGGGYILNEPDETGRWEVATYRWSPGTIVVNQGDEVTLEIVGVNGREHHTEIEGYDLEFVVRRGELTTATFTADEAGIFNIVCHDHQPSMTAQLVVLAQE